ncbi:hypothetical protein JMA_35540 [Jeotgalibacillus malaysiensis]|uniref:Uncharacterized protein n=1 Tax=Jeotgalibacillus malaysiensis TaxID=1508404 RepID=A0A0B5AS37_9BACL|nr:hypothetical protein [Jeotgalibacillus malaysiensis]AJD92871.1 hypothetical protein JMA_35540 [Jeotgalibacillus malaysiensis]
MKRLELNRSQKAIVLLSLAVIFLVSLEVKDYLEQPDNSVDLYQELAFAKDIEAAESLMLEGYEQHFKRASVEYMMRRDRRAFDIAQFTIIEFYDKTYLIETSPGTKQLHILNIEEAPEEVRVYFQELGEKVD